MSTPQPYNWVRWIARLSNGEDVIGLPSLADFSVDRATGIKITHWEALRRRCKEENLYLTGLTMYLPPSTFIRAEENKGGYGWYEITAADSTGRSGYVGIAICWFDGKKIQIRKFLPRTGDLEAWESPTWKPCMIGDPQLPIGKYELKVPLRS